jgi:hypothetical protein
VRAYILVVIMEAVRAYMLFVFQEALRAYILFELKKPVFDNINVLFT